MTSTHSTPPSPLQIFISYSHKDEDLREELDVHLANLKRQGKIQAWHDRAIEAGTEWDAAIKHQLETADVILLLISPRFMASDYCYDLEMQQAVQRHDQGSARVIPIILKPCDWQSTPFSKLQVLPKDAKPITQWSDRDEAFLNVVQGLRRTIESLQAPTPQPSPVVQTFRRNVSTATCTGRDAAIAHLTQTLTSGCRLLVIHGITGIGKTTLAEVLFSHYFSSSPRSDFGELSRTADAQGSPPPLPPSPLLPHPPHIPPFIQVTLDRTLPKPTFTQGAIAILAAMGDDTPQQLPDDQIPPYLLKVLTEKPCWLQLDSLEFPLHQDDHGDSHFTDPTWTDFFCQFLTCTGVRPNAPTIVLTSQALPVDLIEGCDHLSNLWHDYPLRGIAETHWLDLFRNYGVVPQTSTEADNLCQIAHYFDGHPLILKMIAGDIAKPLFRGSVTKYWQNYYSQQTCPKLHQSQEQRARNWVNQVLQTLPPLALQMLQHGSVFRRPVPESFYLKIFDFLDVSAKRLYGSATSDPDAINRVSTDPLIPNPQSLIPTPHSLLTTLKSRYLIEEKDIQNGELLLQLHNLIRDVAYSQLKVDRPTWSAAERKAADLWLTAYHPASDAANLETIRGYLEAFDHYCEVEDWEQASEIYMQPLELTNQPLHWQLLIWGNYQEIVRVSLRLVEQIVSSVKIRCLLNLGLGNYYLSSYKKAIEWHIKALSAAQGIGDRQGEGKALGNLGLGYYSLGNYERAIDCHQQSLMIAREIGNHKGEGAALGNLGLVYERLGNYERASDLHQQRLTIARETGDRRGEGNALGNLGNVYNSLGNYERAIDFHQQYLTISREIGDRQGEAIALGNLGDAYCALGNYSEALQIQNQKLAIARDIQSRDTEAYALSGLGEVLTKLEQYPEAREALQTALEICQATGNRSTEAETLKHLAELHQALGEGEVARQFCQQALALATELGIPLRDECQKLMVALEKG